MEENTNKNPPRKKRPRILRPQNQPQTFTLPMFTDRQNREHIEPQKKLNQVEALQNLVQKPEEFCRTNPQSVKNILLKIVSEYDTAKVANEDILPLVKKYQSAIERKYITSAARQDIKNLLSATPRPLPKREDNIRLECMEQLKKMSEKREITPDQYQYLHQTYFSDIIAKDNLPHAQVSNMLRCMASGKFYAPLGTDGKIDRKKFSPTFLKFLNKPKKTKISAKLEDYDFFGLNEKKQPKSKVWHAVKDSRNFQKLKNIIAKRCIEKDIEPKLAYQLNPADLWMLLTNNIEKPKALEFSAICSKANPAPFEEFSVKLGKILSVGGAKNLNKEQKINLWLNNFASKQEKADFESEHSPDFKLFIQRCERIYQKLEQDFKQNHIHPKFMSLWVESMLKNKSINPSLVDCPRKPYKIDIHHWDRLSSLQNGDNPAKKNNLDNFGVMIMYHNYSYDIHAQEHKGESAHFVLATREQTALNKNRRFLFATSNCLYISDNIMYEASDYTPLNKEALSLNLTIDKQRA